MTRPKWCGQRLNHRERGRDRRKPQPSGETVLERVHFLAHRPRVADDAPSPLEHTFAFGREPLEPGTAVHEQNAECLFQLFYASRQSRLSYATDLSGAAEMPFPGQSK